MVYLPSLRDASAYGFFLDFDGTLIDLASTPDAVTAGSEVRRALAGLAMATSGAVAIVTGREIASIDALLFPLRLPVAGVHGFERRNGADTVLAHAAEANAVRSIETVLTGFASHNPGTLLEKKRGAFALHYRLRPDLEALCLSLMEELAPRLPVAVLTRGKMVIELRLHTATKGTAIESFLAEPPFRGRIPFFAGDDTTDEDGFGVVNALGGISVKIGPGETAANLRTGSPGEFVAWLLETAETLKQSSAHG